MASKERKWAKSKVNTEQVKQNTKDTQQFVELTEKYKTLGSKIESKVDTLFGILKNHFMNFDPTLTVQQELEKSGQKYTIENLLKAAINPFKIDPTKLARGWQSDYDNYIKTLADSAKYQMVIAIEDFKDPHSHFGNVCNAIKNAVFSSSCTEQKDTLKTLANFHLDFSRLPPNERYFQIVECQNLADRLREDYTKDIIKSYLMKYGSALDVKATESLKLVHDSYNILSKTIDPYNTLQIKSALPKIKNTTEHKILSEWLNKTEARDLFLKTTEEFHDTYSSFLDLDNRTGVRVKDANYNTMAEFLSGAKAFDKNDKAEGTQATNETKAVSSSFFITAWSSISSLFSHAPAKEAEKPKEEELKKEPTANSSQIVEKVKKEISDLPNSNTVTVTDEEAKTELSDSKEVAVHNSDYPGAKYKVKKTLAIESYESKEQVHKEYQSLMQVLVDAKKVICFTSVMKQIKIASSCKIRKPFEQANSENKLNCDVEDQKSEVGMSQCDFLFPFATDSDEVITQFLNQSSKVEVAVFDDGQTGLRSHVDTVVAEFTAALGIAVLENYKGQPVVTAQAAMALEYQKPASQDDTVLKLPAPDASATEDHTTSLVSQAALVILEKSDL